MVGIASVPGPTSRKPNGTAREEALDSGSLALLCYRVAKLGISRLRRCLEQGDEYGPLAAATFQFDFAADESRKQCAAIAVNARVMR
jgi:hypothetical protein